MQRRRDAGARRVRFWEPWPERISTSQPDEVVRREETPSRGSRSAAAGELARDAVGDAAGRDDEERQEDERDDRGADAEADERLAPAPPAPDVGDRERHEHGRVELHRDRGAEHAEAEPVAPGARARRARAATSAAG